MMGFIKDIRDYAAGIKAIGELSRKSSNTQFITNDDISYSGNIPILGGTIPDLSFIWGEQSDSNLIKLYHTIEEIFTPVGIIAKAVADGKPVVKKISDDSVVFDNKYLNKLFASPNALHNWQQLVEQMIAYELVTGKNYLYGNVPDPFTLNYRNVATLQNLQVDTVMIDTGSNVKLLSATVIADLIKNFLVSNGAEQIKVSPEKVLYTKHNSLIAIDMGIIGRSPLKAVNKAVEVLAAIYVALGAIYTKGGPRGMIVPKGPSASSDIAWTPIDKLKVVEDINYRLGLGKNKSPFGVTDQQVGWEKMGADVSELQPKEIYQLCCAAIFNLYGIPIELMPGQGAAYENQKTARKSVYEQIAIPRAKSLYQSLTTWLKLEEVGLYLDVDYSHINLLQENLKEKSEVDWRNNETLRVRFTHGICTLNEWRVACKLEAVTGNKMYDKLVFEMDETELKLVETILKLSKGGGHSGGNDNSNQNNNP